MKTCKAVMNKVMNKMVMEMMNLENMKIVKVVRMTQMVGTVRRVIESLNLIKIFISI